MESQQQTYELQPEGGHDKQEETTSSRVSVSIIF